MLKCSIKQEKQTVYIPRASLVILTLFESLDDRFVCGLFSSAFNLFLWLFNSNSTLRKPMQYRRMPNAEMVLAKEGRCCFWLVIFVRVSLSLFHLRTWYVSCYLILLFLITFGRQRSNCFRAFVCQLHDKLCFGFVFWCKGVIKLDPLLIARQRVFSMGY